MTVLIFFALLFALLFAGVPIAFGMVVVGVAGFAVFTSLDASLAMAGQQV